jgi:hypothetical protein
VGSDRGLSYKPDSRLEGRNRWKCAACRPNAELIGQVPESKGSFNLLEDMHSKSSVQCSAPTDALTGSQDFSRGCKSRFGGPQPKKNGLQYAP